MAVNPSSIPRMKLVTLGPIGAGKTSTINRFVREMFDQDAAPTIGASFFSKTMNTSEGPVRLELWDTAGQERYSDAMAPMYCRFANAVLLIYDSSNQASSDMIPHWYQNAKVNMCPAAVVVVVAAKTDLTLNAGAVVPPICVESDHLTFMECSAKTGQGVDELFQFVAQEAMTRRSAGNLPFYNDIIQTAQTNTSSLTSPNYQPGNDTCGC